MCMTLVYYDSVVYSVLPHLSSCIRISGDRNYISYNIESRIQFHLNLIIIIIILIHRNNKLSTRNRDVYLSIIYIPARNYVLFKSAGVASCCLPYIMCIPDKLGKQVVKIENLLVKSASATFFHTSFT